MAEEVDVAEVNGPAVGEPQEQDEERVHAHQGDARHEGHREQPVLELGGVDLHDHVNENWEQALVQKPDQELGHQEPGHGMLGSGGVVGGLGLAGLGLGGLLVVFGVDDGLLLLASDFSVEESAENEEIVPAVVERQDHEEEKNDRNDEVAVDEEVIFEADIGERQGAGQVLVVVEGGALGAVLVGKQVGLVVEQLELVAEELLVDSVEACVRSTFERAGLVDDERVHEAEIEDLVDFGFLAEFVGFLGDEEVRRGRVVEAQRRFRLEQTSRAGGGGLDRLETGQKEPIEEEEEVAVEGAPGEERQAEEDLLDDEIVAEDPLVHQRNGVF